jgi:hypothetical protein
MLDLDLVDYITCDTSFAYFTCPPQYRVVIHYKNGDRIASGFYEDYLFKIKEKIKPPMKFSRQY